MCACPNNKRHYVPHKRELMVLVCAHCRQRKPATKSVPHYNQKRRLLCIKDDLQTVSVPLTASSTTVIEAFHTSASLASNNAFAHVILVEGRRATVPDALAQALVAALAREPALTVRDATLVACGLNKSSALVTLQLEPSALVTERLRALAMHSGCMLPQWPLRIVLGVAPKEQAALAAQELLDTHKGTAPAVDAGHLVSVSPSAEALQFPETKLDSVLKTSCTRPPKQRRYVPHCRELIVMVCASAARGRRARRRACRTKTRSVASFGSRRAWRQSLYRSPSRQRR